MAKKQIPRKIKFRKISDWRKIPVGTLVKCTSGPYFRQNGKTKYLGFHGICKVQKITQDAIIGIVENRTEFIYMGPEVPGVVGIKVAHKVVEVIYE